MTVSSEISFVSYNGDGSTRTFPVPFYFLRDSDLVVNVVDADGSSQHYALGTDYTVSGAGLQSGGSITTIGAPVPAGKTLQIERDPPVTQETSYQANDPFPAKEHEKALDKLTMIAQRHSRTFSNALHFPLTESNDGTLPQKSERALNVLGFDELGNPTMLPMPASVGAGDRLPYSLVAGVDFNPGDTSVLLPRAPGTKGNIEVNFDGGPQDFSEWNVSGLTLSFTSPIPGYIQRIWGYIGTTLSIEVPPDESVTDEKVAFGSKLRSRILDLPSARDYGVVGSGADEHASLQAAINDVLGRPNGGHLFLPDRTIVLGQKIVIPKTHKGLRIYGASSGASILRGGAGFSGPLIEVGAGSAPAGGVEYQFLDFMIGAPISGTCTGLKLINCNTMRLHGLKMQLLSLGIQLDSCFAVRMTECLFDTISQHALYSATAAHNLVIEGSRFYTVGGSAYQTLKIDTETDNIAIDKCDFEFCFGVYGLKNASAVSVTRSYIEYCGGNEFNHDGPVDGWECRGNWIAYNRQPGGPTWDNINGGIFAGNTLAGRTTPENYPMSVAWGANVEVDVGPNRLKGTATLAPPQFKKVTGFSAGYSQAARQVSFSRSFNGRVTLRGSMNSGTLGAAAFALPVGYRPVQQEWFATATGIVTVDANGFVIPQTDSGALVSLDGISFICKSGA